MPDLGLFSGEMKTGEEVLPHPSSSRDFLPSLSRFTPPKLLEDMAASGETFYGRFPPKKMAAA